MLANREKYTRATELRRLQSNDVHRLGEILGLDGGRRLMEIIPKHWHPSEDNKIRIAAAANQPRRYGPEQIRVIEDAAKNNCGYYFAEILIQEWSTHGRRHERPTIGLLLELLIAADMWHAAEFVAEQLLHEVAPTRPLEGPAARFCVNIPEEYLDNVADFAADDCGYFPDTNVSDKSMSVELQNRDYYIKQHCWEKCLEDVLTAATMRRQLQLQSSGYTTTQHIAARVANSDGSTNVIEITKDREQQRTSSLESDSITSPKIPIPSDLLVFSSNSNNISSSSDSSSNGSLEETSHKLSTTTLIPMLTLLGTNVDKSEATLPLQK